MSSGPLLVFDFDHTVTNLNTDVEVQKLAPGGEIPASSEMRGLYSDKGWTDFMGAVFALLHENNVTQAEILSLMAGMAFTPHMISLLEESVRDLGATIIIISDSNSVFIEHILKVRKLDHLVDKVFTNPANWTKEGKLVIKPYHHQETCTLSTKNLCKGQILEDYISTSGKGFNLVCYVGDGKNDFCPSLRLSDSDLVCVREGFSLEKYIPQMTEKGHHIKAEVIGWNSADQILSKLKEKLDK
eukprot:GFUD01026636.1.p1 GENE.GFUD01026636.1~~GFUD01026636.1.p1  ORF type:complete len:243 (+),score=66.13 GFUD01026636.1:44-772(+)